MTGASHVGGPGLAVETTALEKRYGRFWAFQGIELAIYLAMAAVLVGFAFLVVARHDA